MTDLKDNPQGPGNSIDDFLRDPLRVKQFMAYRLLMLLTPKRLSFMLPRIEGMEMFDIPPIYDTLSIDAVSSPTHLVPSVFSGPGLSSRTSSALYAWDPKFDIFHWEAFGGFGTWNATLARWDHTSDRVYLQRIGTWTVGFRPTHVRVTHLGTPQSNFILRDGNNQNIAINTDYPSLTEEVITFVGPDVADDIYRLYMISDHPTITNIEFLRPVSPCD